MSKIFFSFGRYLSEHLSAKLSFEESVVIHQVIGNGGYFVINYEGFDHKKYVRNVLAEVNEFAKDVRCTPFEGGYDLISYRKLEEVA